MVTRLLALLLVVMQMSAHALDLEMEGSGDLTLLDQEDGDDVYEAEGSGGWDVSFGNSPFNTGFEKQDKDYPDEYYYDNYDYLEEYMNKETEDYDDKYLDYLDEVEKDSGLVFEAESDIEIATKPTVNAEEEQIVLNTSQIFIMVGSSFISFAIFMLTFFLCRRMIVNKQRKALAYASTPEKLPPSKEPPIVKDYQKVPTSTQEALRSTSPPRLNMYGDADPENPSAAPLVP